MILNCKLTEAMIFVPAFGPANPSSASPLWFNMTYYNRLTVFLQCLNDSTGSTAAIGLSQATSNAGAGAKTLAFSVEDQGLNITQTAGKDILTATTVTSNTFNTDGTASHNGVYVIDIPGSVLDINNLFNHVQVTIGNSTHQVVSATYIGFETDYDSKTSGMQSALG
jgi:hypothetical protein